MHTGRGKSSLHLNNVNEGASRRESGSALQCAGPVVPKPRLPMDLDAGGTTKVKSSPRHYASA